MDLNSVEYASSTAANNGSASGSGSSVGTLQGDEMDLLGFNSQHDSSEYRKKSYALNQYTSNHDRLEALRAGTQNEKGVGNKFTQNNAKSQRPHESGKRAQDPRTDEGDTKRKGAHHVEDQQQGSIKKKKKSKRTGDEEKKTAKKERLEAKQKSKGASNANENSNEDDYDDDDVDNYYQNSNLPGQS